MSFRSTILVTLVFGIASLGPAHQAIATEYVVGPDAGMLASIGDVPWESLAAGDRVLIHWRTTSYKEKWVICRSGTAESPIVVSGVPGPAGQLPVIDGTATRPPPPSASGLKAGA